MRRKEKEKENLGFCVLFKCEENENLPLPPLPLILARVNGVIIVVLNGKVKIRKV